MRKFIEKNKLISQFQSGFRDKHSCTTALIRVSNDIKRSLRENRVVIMVLFNAPELLLHCLKKIGFCEGALKWVFSFISGKQQYVSIEHLNSNIKPIRCGLLQGDNLSQTFFTIVINGIVNSIKNCQMHLYADDLMIYKECNLNNLNEALILVNEDIKNIGNWVVTHGMELNSSKTQAILISTPINNNKINQMESITKIMVDSVGIQFSNSVKYLGYLFNNEFI